MSKAALITRLTASTVCVAEYAGTVIRQIVSSGQSLGIREKLNERDLQTEADRAAQYCIRKSLSERFGKRLCIIGEEDEADEQEIPNAVCMDASVDVLHYDQQCDKELRDIDIDDLVVWVDPVDGTHEFTEGAKQKSTLLEQVTTLVGIAYQGKPVAGVMHQPFYGMKPGMTDLSGLGRTVWAISGCGVHGMSVQACSNTTQTVVTTRSHSNANVTDTIEALTAGGLVDEVERCGGAGYKVLRVLDGAHAYVFASAGCKKWDTCAPECILVEAGGRLTDMHGRTYHYDRRTKKMNGAGVLATGVGVDHDRYVKLIPENVREALSKQ